MTDEQILKNVKEYWINKLSTISPSYDFESYMYSLFLRFASVEELEGNYVLYSTLKKIETYQELQKEFINVSISRKAQELLQSNKLP